MTSERDEAGSLTSALCPTHRQSETPSVDLRCAPCPDNIHRSTIWLLMTLRSLALATCHNTPKLTFNNLHFTSDSLYYYSPLFSGFWLDTQSLFAKPLLSCLVLGFTRHSRSWEAQVKTDIHSVIHGAYENAVYSHNCSVGSPDNK